MKIDKLPLKSFVPGMKRELTVWTFTPKNLSTYPKIYLHAGLHADEVPPMLVINHLKEKLLVAEQENKLAAEFILIPQANPIGGSQFFNFEHTGRFESGSMENFNRHFFDFFEHIKADVKKSLTQNIDENKKIIRQLMTKALMNITPLTELEDLRFQLLKLSHDADIVLDLHCDFDGLLHIYTGTPIFENMKPLAQFLRSEAQLVSAESGGNPFDEAVTKTWWQLKNEFPEFPIPFGTTGATVEFRGKQDVTDELAEADAENIYQYFVFSDFIKGNKKLLPELVRNATPLDATQFIKVERCGILIFKKAAGDWIKAGEAIAEILDPTTSERMKVVSEVEGQFLTKTNQRWCYSGMYIGKIVGDKSYRTGALLSAR